MKFNLSTTATLGREEVAAVERWPSLWRGDRQWSFYFTAFLRPENCEFMTILNICHFMSLSI